MIIRALIASFLYTLKKKKKKFRVELLYRLGKYNFTFKALKLSFFFFFIYKLLHLKTILKEIDSYNLYIETIFSFKILV